MRRLFLFVVAVACVSIGLAQGPYRTVTVKQIQQVPLDSLLKADTLQNSIPSRWTLQTSTFNVPPAAVVETVEVVVQVIVPPKVATYDRGGFTLVVRDTGSTGDEWSSIYCRVNLASDTTLNFKNNGFLNIERGDIVRLRGFVGEFPTSMNSLTQFNLAAGININAIDNKPLPPLVSKSTSDFNQGNPLSGGKVKYSTGEPYEGAYVTLTNLTVTGTWSPGAGRTNLTLVDQSGNTIFEYDVSSWFTTLASRKYTSDTFSFSPPPFGATIDTLRGIIWQVSGSQNNSGFLIAPMFPGDLAGIGSLPFIATHRRNPVTLMSADTAFVSVKAAIGPVLGYPIKGVYFYRRYNNGPWIPDSILGGKPDSTYLFKIPPQSANTFVNYYFVAVDTNLSKKVYANSSSGSLANDTSAGFFSYTVLDRPYAIYDIQYTPYRNGRTEYLGATNIAVNGIITADTSDIGIAPLNAAGTSAWFMQNTNQPWNGIWVVGPDSVMSGLKKGDSVSVTVDVTENFDVTQLYNARYPVNVIAQNKTLPSPVVLTTGTFGSNVGNGTASAEQWEGMLVRFNNVTVSSINPIFSDQTEYEINDGSGGILVRRDGRNQYSNIVADTSVGKTVLYAGDQLSYMQGVVHFSFNRYKVVPRGNSDIGITAPIAPVLLSPGTGGTGQPLNVVLKWRRSPLTARYRLQVATDAAFSSLVINDSTIADTTSQMAGLAINTKYYWRVNAKNLAGTSSYSGVFDFTTGTQTAVDKVSGVPREFELDQNYPNPFNPSTKIRFALPTQSSVRLQIFNILGQEIARLVDGQLDAKFYEIRWNAPSASSGLYFYRIEAVPSGVGAPFVEVKKMMLIK